MEYSQQLSQIALIFIKSGFRIEIFEKQLNEKYHTIVCNLIENTGFKNVGSASGRDRFLAFIRSIVESGEVLIAKQKLLNNRSGLAGGIFLKQTIQRAAAELIERDAFLFHYRSGTPGRIIEKDPSEDLICLLELSTASKDFYVVMATTKNCAFEDPECLLIGLGCSRNLKQAKKKAIEELKSVILDHQIRPGYCKGVFEKKISSPSLADFHHSYSRDKRNISKFQRLFSESAGLINRNTTVIYEVEKIESPIKFFKYARLQSSDLIKLEFGVPEENSKFEAPLYHPLW